MIYEERYTRAELRRVREYLHFCRDSMLPAMHSAGGQVICLATGLIGDPNNAVLQITGFSDLASWQAAQANLASGRNELVQSEEVRLLRPIASRPKEVIPSEDRRPVYSYRRFFINPSDLAKFVECSEDGVWPLYEAVDCRVLGLWTPLPATSPLEIILMAGYHGPGHWEETRFFQGKPEGLDDGLWERGQELGRQRGALSVQGSWVRLWRVYPLE
jgi:hypothetical protein